MVSEKAIGGTRKIEHPTTIAPEGDSLFSIEPGKCLCDYFPLEYALGIAMGLHLPSYSDDSLHTKITSVKQGLRMSKRHRIIVLVYPGQMFKGLSKTELLIQHEWKLIESLPKD